MVVVWYYDGKPGDQRLPHKTQDAEEIPMEKLAELGVLYWKVDLAS